MAAAANMLKQWSWAVVGSHGRNPIAERLVHKLEAGGKKVFKVNPGLTQGSVLSSLALIGEPVDVVDLVVNPAKGLDVVKEMHTLGIKNLWIQPGAASQEILQEAQKHGIEVHEGCVLVEARW